MSDIEAIRRLKQGDITGLEILVTRYQLKALRAAFMILQDEQLAEDAVQDTYLSLFRRMRNFDESRPFEPYLMRCVVNTALNLLAQKWPEDSLDGDEPPTHLEILLAQAVNVESQVEGSLLREEIELALQKLSPRQRAVIVQRYYLGMDENEMVQNLEIAPGTVRWLLHAARSRLRMLLSPKGEKK
jgi:RNA polymerase sigma-70 factor (ECF subfamily)